MNSYIVIVGSLLAAVALPLKVPGADAVVLPPELTHLDYPSGKGIVMKSGEVSVASDSQIRIQLSWSGPKRFRKKGAVGRVAVFYLTKYANLQATGATDFGGPSGMLGLWNKALALGRGMGSKSGIGMGVTTFASKDRFNRPTGGVAGFAVEQSPDGNTLAASGTLPVPLEELAPQALGLVAMGEGQPVSNFLWVSLGTWAERLPSTAAAARAVAPPAAGNGARPLPVVASKRPAAGGAQPAANRPSLQETMSWLTDRLNGLKGTYTTETSGAKGVARSAVTDVTARGCTLTLKDTVNMDVYAKDGREPVRSSAYTHSYEIPLGKLSTSSVESKPLGQAAAPGSKTPVAIEMRAADKVIEKTGQDGTHSSENSTSFWSDDAEVAQRISTAISDAIALCAAQGNQQ